MTVSRRSLLKFLGLGAAAAATVTTVRYQGQEPPSPETMEAYKQVQDRINNGPHVNPCIVTKDMVGLGNLTTLPNGDVWIKV